MGGNVRAKLLILDLDEGDTGGDSVSSITHDGHEAILDEVVGLGLIAVNTSVDMVCVRMICKGDHRGTSDCWR